MQNPVTQAVALYAFDPSVGFNDPNTGSFYSFKIEDVIPGRYPTVSQALITYRDLGTVNLTFIMTGTNEQQQELTQQTQVSWGNSTPTGRLMTKVQALGFPACMNVQLTISRAANAGPVSIVKLILCGRVEVAQQFA